MYRTAEGEDVFVVDGHLHFWDASPGNQKNEYGKGWIDCFYGYHKVFTPPEYLWPLDQYQRYSDQQMLRDLFVDGYVDVGIFQPTNLKEFYINGFNTTEQDAVLKDRYPDRFILNGTFDPRDGERGLDYLREQRERYAIQGVKLYTAEWNGASKGYKLTDPVAYRYLEECQRLGIRNIHVHKGPTIWPLNKDGFDVADVDQVATDFLDLNFVVEHCGLPRLEEFCYIATQERNVYGGLAVIMPFIRNRPRAFATMLAELLYWVGEDKLTFGSDYAIWHPRWIIEDFINFELPEDLKQEYGIDLTLAGKRKILGENAARLYGLDIESHKRKLAAQPLQARGLGADYAVA
jgi:predicted TIM-barrel fold metal-dependent hydrolase